MNVKEVAFADTLPERWDEWSRGLDDATYFHCRHWLAFSAGFSRVLEHLSFALLGDRDEPLALCPLAVSEGVDGEREISFSGMPVAVPAAARVAPSARRKLLDAAYSRIAAAADKYGAQTLLFGGDPLTVARCRGDALSDAASFEPLRYGLHYHVLPTQVIDLAPSEEELVAAMSKYQRRHVRKARAAGLRFMVFSAEHNREGFGEHFRLLQEAHRKAAGGATRPQCTWDAMRRMGEDGQASLFVVSADGVPASFLFCGEFSAMAFGWSQVNDKERESRGALRHLLEWEAIVHYKRRGFRFYELGARFYGPQLFYAPSPKEITISEFKERYGALQLPKVSWFGYRDQAVMEKTLTEKTRTLLKARPLFRLPGEEENG
ncbi:MAG: GNAT family N-acetyltransferase [Elusimicrobiota bacterium]